jgi:lipid II isoglutaminyl synthase (glutamine-hydrolysing)
MRHQSPYNQVMPVFWTLAICKLAAASSRLLGRGGGQALPGLVAERLDPHLARKLGANLSDGVILVTGTNGKTTTTKLLVAMLEADGRRVLTNSTGSNLKRGITSALIRAADIRGNVNYTLAVFEVDEASLRHVAPELQPRQIVVLNLFRDQLDRYGELDTTAALIGQGIAATQAQLILNADDPLVASLSTYAQGEAGVRTFGIEGLPVSGGRVTTASDSERCPVCRRVLKFSRVFYGHIGHYRCPNGDFSRPQPELVVTSVESSDTHATVFTLGVRGRRYELRYPLPGVYNLYNALAAASVADAFGVPTETYTKAMEVAGAAFGRVERVNYRGRVLCVLLIKNPAGFTQVLQTFLLGRTHLHAMFVINDLDADGRDVSWLWDVPLEAWAGSSPVAVTAGIRSADMALRLKYAGIASHQAQDLLDGIDRLLHNTKEGDEVYILPTYTAMLQVRNVLSNLTQIEKVS